MSLSTSQIKIVADGNSYVQGNGYTSFATVIASSLGIPVLNYGVGGQTTPQMIADETNQILSQRVYGKYNFLLVCEGGNDIYINGSVTNAVNNMRTYCNNARQKGYRVIVCTTISRDQTTPAGDNPIQYNAKLVQFNQAIIDDNSFYDALVRVDLEPMFATYTAGGYDVDKVHPNQTGQNRFAQLYQDAINFLSSEYAIRIKIAFSVTAPPETLPTPILSLVNTTDDAIQLEFSDLPDGATGFRLDRQIEGIYTQIYQGQTAAYLDDELDPNTLYNYRLQVYRSSMVVPFVVPSVIGGTSVTSDYAYLSATTASAADGVPPTIISRAATSSTNVRIQYSEPMGTITAAGHSFSGNNATGASLVMGNTYDYTTSGLSFGQTITHTYNSASGNTLDLAGNELVGFTNASVTNNIPNPADVTAPSVPTGLTATNVSQTSFTLNWGASSDAVGVTQYEVFRNGVSYGTTGGTSLSITGLTSSTQYSMTVRARDAAGNYSAQSSALVVTTSAAVGGGTFTASTVPGLMAWTDATDDANTTVDGSGNVSQVNDKSGNNRHMVQSTAGNRPARATGGINGNKFLQLTPSASISIPTLNDSQPYTIYIAGTHRSNIGLMAAMNGAQSVNMMVSNTIYGTDLFDYTVTLGGGGNQYGRMTNILRLNTPQIWRFILDNNATGIKINREPAYPRNFAGAGTGAIEKLTVGGGSVSWDFYEALVYDHHVTDSEHAAIQTYLYNKYPVPNGDYISFLGDSITQGLSPQFEYQQYTWLVAKELSKTHYNYGISGATLHQAGGDFTKGWDTQVLNAIGEANTGIVTSVIGYNNDRNGNEVQWKADYKSGVQQLLNAGYAANKIFLFSPIHSLTGYSGTNAQLDAMATDIQAIASELGVTYGDLLHYTRNRANQYTMPDGVHPEQNGHRLMADYVKSVIQGSPLSI